MGWTMSTWLNRGASGGLAGALKIERSNPQPIHLSQVKACSGERSRLYDLAWLNDYDLARVVCDQRLPVLTGIGHERDSTILDEVAFAKFDTPSKVIVRSRS